MIKEELLYELILQDEEDGVFAVSTVSSPAIEIGFQYFGKEINFQAVNEEKMLVAGPLLIPNKKILRLDGEGKSYYVFFSPQTIEKIARKFMKNKYNDKVTLEHDKKVDGIYLTESWIIEQSAKDKSNIYGFTLPKGTWFGVYDVSGNQKVWEEIKNGTYSGFSIEGLFEHKKSDLKLSLVEKPIDELTEEEANVVLSQIKALIKKDKRYKAKQRVEMESYSDYGEGIRNNAKKGIELNERNGNKCATQVGKVRAQQLANGEAISIETIKRMYSYLSRAEVYYDQAESNSDCGYISFLLWGGKAALGWSRNKLKELGLLTETEAQPSFPGGSSYPGQGPTKRKKQKLQADCPEATQNIKVNLENRQHAIDTANYGPLNPNEPNEEYWKAKADQFKTSVEEAKTALCANCGFFNQTKAVLECIAQGIGEGTVADPYDTIEAGDVGYCEAFDFKCAGSRTCDAWLAGGPITD